MDDPFGWDVDRVVQELCSPDRTWIGIPSPDLPPSGQLEACLREQGADGHTMLTYPDESELYESLGIRTLKHKSTFQHARSQLRRRSQMYQHYLTNPIVPENARPGSLIVPIHSSVAPVTAPAPAPAPATTIPVSDRPADHKTRRVAPVSVPVPVPTEGNTHTRTQALDKARPALQSDRDDLGIQERTLLKPLTDVAVKKSTKRAYASGPTGDNTDLQERPAVVAREDSTNLHTNEEEHDQHRAKRPKQDIEVIELSDDDNDNNQASNQEPEPVDGVSDSHSRRELDSDFGGRYANRHITENDWTRVCKMFQCPASTTILKPPGFGIEIAAYQLHAIWWMLTQRPVRGTHGGCLGDAMGLGKTIEVLSTFAIFAMIKANYEEVANFWKDGVITRGRQHLPQEQTKEDRCPSQQGSPYPTECTCVKSGDPYKIARRMPSLPTICVVPPTAMRFWAAEFYKVLDTMHTIAGHLRLSVWHNDYSKDQELYHGQDRVQLTAGTAVRHVGAHGGVQLLVGGRPKLSN